MKNEQITQVTYLEVTQERAGQRLDNYLLSQLKQAPRSLIYRIIRSGEVRVNKGRAKANYRLQAGDQVRVPPLRLPEKKSVSASSASRLQLEQAILYEDKRIIVLNKPAGMAVHGGSGVQLGVIEILRQMHPHAKEWELVHRLDRDTSGCLVIAKKRSALRELHQQFREHSLHKRYFALLYGRLSSAKLRIDAPLRKNQLQSGERIVRVDPAGKAALSEFKLREDLGIASAIDVILHTGRTHQIRVHAQHIGHPIAGDEKYGDREFNRKIREYGCRHLCLHAASISFKLQDGERLRIDAPIPAHIQQLLEQLREVE